MSNSVEEKAGYLIGGGVVAGILASLCCLGPLVLTIVGVSGVAALAKFDVIRWPMTILVIVIFAYQPGKIAKLWRKKAAENSSAYMNPSVLGAKIDFL